jgi:hypothetical protein
MEGTVLVRVLSAENVLAFLSGATVAQKCLA